MFSKSLFAAVLIRITLILITSLAFVIVLGYLDREYYMTLFGIGALILYQVYLLSRHLNEFNRKLALFFKTVRNEDSVLKYSHDQPGQIFESLYASLDDLNSTFGEMRRQNARQALFLKNLIEHVGVGLIFYNEQGEIEIFNNAAIELLQINQPGRIADIANHHPELTNCIKHLQPGDQKLVRVLTKTGLLYLTVKLMIFIAEEDKILLLSMQNIRTELEHRELDSWQKLIRVLSHEISNSVGPVNSLANTTRKYFVGGSTGSIIGTSEVNNALLRKTVENLDVIESTGKMLIDFVGKYRSLTAIPQPRFDTFPVAAFFSKLQTLLDVEAQSRGIDLAISSSPVDLEIKADAGLLEQVLINLIKNSMEALNNSSDAKISINAHENFDGRIVIEVEDNGCGIPPDIIEEIFIPFYTSKDTGSGIGLSLSRQIMRLHGGTISVRSTPHEFSIFSLVF